MEPRGEDIAQALDSIARALRDLGNADAATPMGALEAHGKTLGNGLDSIASSLGAIAEALDRIATAMENRKP